MPKETRAQRRATHRRLADKAATRAQEYRAREESAKRYGKDDKAALHAATAARAEMLAARHIREIERLDERNRRLSREGETREERERGMRKAQERAAAAAAARPEPDPLQAYEEAMQLAAGLEAEAVKHDKTAGRYVRAGDQRRAEISTGGAERSRERAAQWRKEAERIQCGTGRNLARELAASIKARARAADRRSSEASRLDGLGVESDQATAAGQRHIALGGRGKGKRIAMLGDYASLIRKPGDRTKARLDAMEDFDTLIGTAESGLLPPPRFEAESSSGKGPGDAVMANRAAGLIELDMVRDAIGGSNVEMLRGWIYERRTLAALSREGFGSDRTIGALALAALDALAVYMRTRSALAARLAVKPQPEGEGGRQNTDQA